jgi:hypothetical protein
MIITLSRQLGSQGDLIAARVAAACGLRLIDRAQIYGIALAAGLSDNLLQQLMYERRRSLAAEFLDSLGASSPHLGGSPLASANPLGSIIVPMLRPASLSLEEGVRTLGLLIKDIAARGDVLILGQGSQVWLRGHQNACHVQIVAPAEVRVTRVAEQLNVPPAEAGRLVRDSDRARSGYLSRYHGVNWQDPLLYHLVINTGQVPIETAVSLVVNAGQALAGRA